jgi:glutathione S-transferase
MADYTLYYWPVPFRGQFIRAILAYAGKSWDERDDDIVPLMEKAPGQQPIPFMGPPVLVVEKTGFAVSQMPAIAFYLGETLGLLPKTPEGRALTLKIVNDANDVIDEITIDGGQKMWTKRTWDDFVPRLRRWMAMWEVTGQRNGLKSASGFLLGGMEPSVADIVTATLWSTLRAKFPKIGEMLDAEAPLVAALSQRVQQSPALAKLARDSDERYGEDTYCGGQIGQSLAKVAGA